VSTGFFLRKGSKRRFYCNMKVTRMGKGDLPFGISMEEGDVVGFSNLGRTGGIKVRKKSSLGAIEKLGTCKRFHPG